MSDQEELISQFKDITGVSEEQARFHLEAANWTLQVSFCTLRLDQPDSALFQFFFEFFWISCRLLLPVTMRVTTTMMLTQFR